MTARKLSSTHSQTEPQDLCDRELGIAALLLLIALVLAALLVPGL
jgi:hypothetical protein